MKDKETPEEGDKWMAEKLLEEKKIHRYDIGFYDGFKHAEKVLYSEEELHNAFYNGWLYRGENYSFPEAKKEWVELFKK